jgi:hypothetical protein
VSRGAVELVSPSVDDGMLVEMLDSGHEAIPEFLFGGDTDVAQHGSGDHARPVASGFVA